MFVRDDVHGGFLCSGGARVDALVPGKDFLGGVGAGALVGGDKSACTVRAGLGVEGFSLALSHISHAVPR